MGLSVPSIERPQAVLFACNMNAVRSPMAAALMRLRFGALIFVDSCGAAAGILDPMTVEVMDEIGVDLSRHRPKSFDALEDESFDVIVSLTPRAHHLALERTRREAIEVEYWPCSDPTLYEGPRDQRLQEFRFLRDALRRRIADRFERPMAG